MIAKFLNKQQRTGTRLHSRVASKRAGALHTLSLENLGGHHDQRQGATRNRACFHLRSFAAWTQHGQPNRPGIGGRRQGEGDDVDVDMDGDVDVEMDGDMAGSTDVDYMEE